MRRWIWFVILIWASFVVGAFLYAGQPLYICIFTASVPLLALYVVLIGRLFNRRLSARGVAVVGAALLVVLAGGEAWVRSSDSNAKGALPWIVQTIHQWKRSSIPETADKRVSDAQATAIADDGKIFDQLADLITRQRCTAHAHEMAANETGWSFVLAPSNIDAMQKVKDDKIVLAEYRDLMQGRINALRKFDANGQGLILGISASGRDKAMKQFSSAENMIIDTQSAEFDARERQLQAVDQILDISLRAYSRSPNHSQGPVYTPSEAAQVNALVANVRTQNDSIKKLYDRMSYDMSYADNQLNTLVTPALGSPSRHAQCPKDIVAPSFAVAVNQTVIGAI